MNNVINKCLLAGDKFMPEMHLRQPQFVYSVCGPFTRHKERIKEFKRTGDTRYIYRNELDKACFQHDSAYEDHKDLINRTEADKVLRDKAYDIASNPEYDGYQRGLASMVYKFFDKKSMGSGIASSSILADELHKPVIEKFEKRKVYSQFKDNIWGVDLTDMQSLSRKDKGIKHIKGIKDIEHNEKRSRFKVADRVRIFKFKNIFAKGYTPNWSREIFIVNKINDTVPYTYNIKDLNDEETIGSFYDTELQKSIL